MTHGNIVSIFDFGTHEAVAFLVMELLPGPTLATVIAERGPLPVEEALEIVEQVASALQAAHAVGVVHRDIKPGNLMLDARGRVKVVDFGIARLLESTSKQLRMAGSAGVVRAVADGVGAAPAVQYRRHLRQDPCPVGGRGRRCR